MTTTDESPAVKVGVRLDADPDSLGEWLADGSAFDAAGADALWIDGEAQAGLDVLALAAALAVVTDRSEVVLAVDDATARAAGLARSLETIRRLSHGRLVLAVDAQAADDVIDRVADLPILHRESDESGWIDRRAGAGELARWTLAATPPGRAAWRETRADAAAHGAYGLVVPAGPLLLDILRNPNDPGGRRDLQLAQG